MIDSVDRRLANWVGTVLDSIEVSHRPPTDDAGGAGVSLFLLELGKPSGPAGGGLRRPPLEIRLRYLVTTWAEDPLEAHRMLGELAFSALEAEELEVEQQVGREVWTSLGVAARPGFIVTLPLRRERPDEDIPLVRQPLKTGTYPAIALHGSVVGPGDVPLARATVELPALDLRARTDDDGRFRLPLVPTEPRHKELVVRARGKVLSVVADTRTAGEEPLLIRVEL